MKRNPFSVLGFDPELIRELNDLEIQSLIKNQYRYLQTIFHPDKRKGKEERSKEISEAYSLLDRTKNPLFYEEFKKKFLRTNRNGIEISSLESALRVIENEKSQLLDSFQKYLLSFADKEECSLYNADKFRFKLHDYRYQQSDFAKDLSYEELDRYGDEEIERQKLAENQYIEDHESNLRQRLVELSSLENEFNNLNVQIKTTKKSKSQEEKIRLQALTEALDNVKKQRAEIKAKIKKKRSEIRAFKNKVIREKKINLKQGIQNVIFYEMTYSHPGHVICHKKKMSGNPYDEEFYGKFLIGSVRAETVVRYDTIKKFIELAHNSNVSLNQKDLYLPRVSDRNREVKRLLERPIYVKNAEFLIKHLSPVFDRHSHMFSLNISEGEEPHFLYEGVIKDINPIE